MGYFRADAASWEAEHYAGRWSAESPAPAWWVAFDVAWSVDRQKLPSARDAAEAWGWSKNRAAAAIRAETLRQAEWEARPERKDSIAAMLESWSAKGGAGARAKAKTRTDPGQGVRSCQDTKGTADNGQTPTTDATTGRIQDETRTDPGQIQDSRAILSLPAATATSTASPEFSSPSTSEDDPDPPPGRRATAPPVPAEGQPTQPPLPGMPADAAEPRDPAAEVYAAYRRHHPRKPATPSAEDRRYAATIAAGMGDLADRYLRWAHESSDVYPQKLQGKLPMEKDQPPRRYLSLEHLSRHLDKRRIDVEDWQPPPPLDPEIAAALRSARAAFAACHPSERAVIDPGDDTRDRHVRAAVHAAGGRKAFDAAPRLDDRRLAAFIDAYHRAKEAM